MPGFASLLYVAAGDVLLKPMTFFATDIPNATPGALLAPTATAMDKVFTTASIFEASSAVTLTLPRSPPPAVVVRLPPVICALLVPRMVLKASDPPPLTPIELPVPAATPIEVADTREMISPDFCVDTSTSPVIAPVALETRASTV